MLVISRTFAVIGIGQIDMVGAGVGRLMKRDGTRLKRGRYVESRKVGGNESSKSERDTRLERTSGDACVSVNGAWLSVARHSVLSFSFLWRSREQ